MSESGKELLERVQRELMPGEHDNRLIPLVASGEAPLSVLGALAAEQHRIISSDWRSFLTLAAQAVDPAGREVFSTLAGGEGIALAKLGDFAAACGLDDDAIRAYRPRPGCQAYPAYLAWLALNGSPRDALLAILANFAAWGGYCATISAGLREHYGFDEKGTGFFDFFATPDADLEALYPVAVQQALDGGWTPDTAIGFGRLLQGYELMFWNTLADLAG
ncbi:transcriptional regulator [Actinokineospora inagensis]|uniref:transcriptional regulator n=1 Tax=Actinokineospora inagensis TaxID=103730 RepID=UPI00041750D9|nr:transcriptional regulator [Actinokineospora inagensis]